MFEFGKPVSYDDVYWWWMKFYSDMWSDFFHIPGSSVKATIEVENIYNLDDYREHTNL